MKNKEIETENITVLTVGFPEVKAYMGDAVQGTRKIYWSDGDQLCVNGVSSQPLSGIADGTLAASFTFNALLYAPCSILFPASSYADATHVNLPSSQAYTEGSFDSSAILLAGESASLTSSISITHLMALVHIAVKAKSGTTTTLSSITFEGNDGEQLSGSFTIDYSVPSLSPNSTADADKKINISVAQSLSQTDALDIFIAVPSRTYSHGFTVTLKDSNNLTMRKIKSSSVDLTPGKLVNMPEFVFDGNINSEFGIDDIIEEDLVMDSYNVTGAVIDGNGNPVEGVVVSDGEQCVRTTSTGHFYMQSNTAETKFIYISTPSGYIPPVENGIPRFYKLLSGITPSSGIYDCGNFTLTPVSNPDRYTLLITADPQPRKYASWNNDRIAFRSLDVCEDLYDELASVASGISGRQVYGICLGDIVHETMDLYDNYDIGLSRLGYPTYNVIGNHDNDPSAADDDAGAIPFETHYGPRNYSFNIGGIHYVVLDNLIMKANPDNDNKLTSFDQGLTDKAWAWLQADMAFVPTSTKIMVCAHSPMFKILNGNERTNTAKHGGSTNTSEGGAFGYGDLFDQYPEVHAWAGHTHVGFNFNYSSTHRHKNVQVHTLARSTGELWTNEYLASGTPRGFTVVEVDNGNISWKFHPLRKQTGAFVGVSSGICSAGAPAYNWRDWDYNASGIAVMRNGGGPLTEDYQLHVYPRGSYGDNYVYANVFLWDSAWSLPVWTPDGGTPVTMTLINSVSNHNIITDTDKIYDLANTEFKSHYKAKVGFFKNDDGYPSSEVGEIVTLFRAPASASPASGTVSVTDRFGNTYTRSVSW